MPTGEEEYSYKPLRKANEKYKRTSRRVLIKSDGEISESAIKARIIASTGKIFVARKIDATGRTIDYDCEISGALISPYSRANLAAVGDEVYLIDDDIPSRPSENPRGRIVKICERDSWIARRDVINPAFSDVLAANLDFFAIMCSCKSPKYNRRLIDRMLIAAEAGGVRPILIVNKIDLVSEKALEEIVVDFSVYEEIGVPVFFASVEKRIELEDLYREMARGVSLLAGQSGVGKSSLINAVFGDDVQKIKQISKKSNKGAHTTADARTFFFDKDFLSKYADPDVEPKYGVRGLVDSPGIREFGLPSIEICELALYFPDFEDFRENCKFMPCTHDHEPGCAVKAAVERGEIDFDRYESYINILYTLEK